MPDTLAPVKDSLGDASFEQLIEFAKYDDEAQKGDVALAQILWCKLGQIGLTVHRDIDGAEETRIDLDFIDSALKGNGLQRELGPNVAGFVEEFIEERRQFLGLHLDNRGEL